MRPSDNELPTSEDPQDALLVLAELGKALRLSLDAEILEPLPTEICSRLMRLAFAGVVRDAADDELRTVVLGPSNKTFVIIIPEARIRPSCGPPSATEFFDEGCRVKRPAATLRTRFRFETRMPLVLAKRNVDCAAADAAL